MEDGPAGRQRCRDVQGLRRDPGRAEGVCHGIRGCHRGGKEQRLAVGGVGLKGGEHLRRRVGRQQQSLQVGLDKIAALGAQRIEVGLEQRLDGPQVDQIPGLHHLHQAALVHDAVKDLLEGLAIAPRGRRRHPHHQRPLRLPGATMGEDRAIEGAGAWCASSMTMVRKLGTRRASRARRRRVCTLAATMGRSGHLVRLHHA